jgi:hypothetical protein
MPSAPSGQLGYWDAGTDRFLKERQQLPTNVDINDVPFMPWSRL